MKKELLIILSAVLILILLVPAIKIPDVYSTTESTGDISLNKTDSTTKLSETTEPIEPTIQTDGNDTVDDGENAGSGSYDEFFEKYTRVY